MVVFPSPFRIELESVFIADQAYGYGIDEFREIQEKLAKYKQELRDLGISNIRIYTLSVDNVKNCGKDFVIYAGAETETDLALYQLSRTHNVRN